MRHQIFKQSAPYGLFSLFLLLMAVPIQAEEIVVDHVVLSAESSYLSERSYAGQTVPTRSSQLGFVLGGEVAELGVDEGDEVTRGSLLATLDQRNLRTVVQAAEADVLVASANVSAMQSQAQLALNTAKRTQQLHDEGHVSAQMMDEARLTAKARGAEFKLAKANLQKAEAALAGAKVRLTEATIVAPFDGVIQTRYVDEGAQIRPGQPVLKLVESRLEARIGLPDLVAAEIEQGTHHHLRWNDRIINARLKNILPEIDPTSRTQTAVFEIRESNIPMGAVVELLYSEEIAGDGFWLPIDALLAADRGLWAVYAISPDEIIERRLVEVIHTEASRVFVRGTLQAGDRIVSTGVQRIVPGQRVAVRNLIMQNVTAAR